MVPPSLSSFARRTADRARAHPARAGVLAAGALLALVAGAPLAWRALAAFLSLPEAWRVTLCAAGLVMVALAAGRGARVAERFGRARMWVVIAAAWAAVVLAVLLLVAGAWWVMGAPEPQFPDRVTARSLDGLATRAFAVVAGLGGVALLVIHYRRQRTTEAENERAEAAVGREVTRLFDERFTTAYKELGNESAAVRLGAVHALAHLADDAPSNGLTQTVIDVLCAYLRMPYAPAPEPAEDGPDGLEAERMEFAASREVRHTIIRIIGDRLREKTRWRGRDYDFSGVVFDGGDFTGARFTGGRVRFNGARFVEGRVDFTDAVFEGGSVNFAGASFEGAWVHFIRSDFAGATVGFFSAQVNAGALNFDRATFRGKVSFLGTRFMGGRAIFSAASFEDGGAIFSRAEFGGGRAYFDDVEGPCPPGLLEAVEQDRSGGVEIPERWRVR